MTRDGIPIETSVNVAFQVKMQASPLESTLPYPYIPEAIFGVNYLNTNTGTQKSANIVADKILLQVLIQPLLVLPPQRHTLAANP